MISLLSDDPVLPKTCNYAVRSPLVVEQMHTGKGKICSIVVSDGDEQLVHEGTVLTLPVRPLRDPR